MWACICMHVRVSADTAFASGTNCVQHMQKDRSSVAHLDVSCYILYIYLIIGCLCEAVWHFVLILVDLDHLCVCVCFLLTGRAGVTRKVLYNSCTGHKTKCLNGISEVTQCHILSSNRFLTTHCTRWPHHVSASGKKSFVSVQWSSVTVYDDLNMIQQCQRYWPYHWHWPVPPTSCCPSTFWFCVCVL